jgi:hypothetical protein
VPSEGRADRGQVRLRRRFNLISPPRFCEALMLQIREGDERHKFVQVQARPSRPSKRSSRSSSFSC